MAATEAQILANTIRETELAINEAIKGGDIATVKTLSAVLATQKEDLANVVADDQGIGVMSWGFGDNGL